MSKSITIKIVVLVTVSVPNWTLLGKPSLSVSSSVLSPLAILSIALLILAYDRCLWRLPLVRRLTGVPLLAGTWRGTLVSTYSCSDVRQRQPILVAMLITQTASTVTVSLFTNESMSTSTTALLTRLKDRRWSLSWSYENTPCATVRDRSVRHRGKAEANVGIENGAILGADYFTDRHTSGEIKLVDWSPSRYGTLKSAFQATNFRQPQPFPGVSS
jgi:hypothetical protein